jgi:preprotein translocase subunit SecA
MLKNILTFPFNSLAKFFKTANERKLQSYRALITQINNLEEHYSNLSEEQLKNQTTTFKERLQNGHSLDDILPEAFATVREASRRILGLRHFDVQLIGGIALHQGMISEMRTGEGKTLVATLPAYLNALTGKGVHIVTVNDYLASRDTAWMGVVFRFLGLSVGCITHNLPDSARKEAYACDITYGTNNEFGFDYLRDNMKYSLEDIVQRQFNYAIIDEVDSILIDEARTPLIISGPSEENVELYAKVNSLISILIDSDYEVDEKTRNVTLTEAGNNHLENLLKSHNFIDEQSNLYDPENVNLVHHTLQSLKAHKIFKKDVDYLIQDDKVMIIDEFSGRVLTGRRYSEGLHQAIEAKEGLKVHNENQTLASITFQNYFRLYPKLSGMTGTASTEAAEFYDTYNLEVLVIPTNKPIEVKNEDDEFYLTLEEKDYAILNETKISHAKGQPILIGTGSIEKSEHLSKLLKANDLKHQVLNAKYHEQEAYIIAQAGRLGAITIATNMAGRGTDIILGGNPVMLLDKETDNRSMSEEAIQALKVKLFSESQENKQKVLEAGGLYVIGTERHESRRIDNQLRGRTGRQGDPGKTKFYLSPRDDLMRNFAPERMFALFTKIGMKKNEPISHPMITKAIEKAQTRVEGHNYEVRKNLLKYDDVVNEQRKIIYSQRLEIIASHDISETVIAMIDSLIQEVLSKEVFSANHEPNIEGLHTIFLTLFGLNLPIKEWLDEQIPNIDELSEKIFKEVRQLLSHKEQKYGAQLMRYAEKQLFLLSLDSLWKDHLLSLDHLRNVIGLRAYGQKNPLIEYKQEALLLFAHLLTSLKEAFIMRITRVEFADSNDGVESLMKARKNSALSLSHSHENHTNESFSKIGRNEVCFCGSGKKYKHCHGKL